MREQLQPQQSSSIASPAAYSQETRLMIMLYHNRDRVRRFLKTIVKLNLSSYEEGTQVWKDINKKISSWYKVYNSR